MDGLSEKIPEIKTSKDVNEIPWKTAVVWSSMPRIGPRVYEWVSDEDIRYVSWTNGIVTILPKQDSILSANCQCIVVPQGFVWIGRDVKVA